MPTYSKEFRIKVAKEASLSSSAGMEHIIAKKYGIKPWTVIKWRDAYMSNGEMGLSPGRLRAHKTNRELALEKENAALREEVEILKKAAAFLANVKRD